MFLALFRIMDSQKASKLQRNQTTEYLDKLPADVVESLPGTLGVVMNSIEGIQPEKDTTLGLLEAAQRRGWKILYFTPGQLFLKNGQAFGYGKHLTVRLDTKDWYSFESIRYCIPLSRLGFILMRVDPPVDEAYLTTCQLLEFAQQQGTLVVNSPKSLRLLNEKILAQMFPQFSPPTLISRSPGELLSFAKQYEDTVIKPLNQMGGIGIQRLTVAAPLSKSLEKKLYEKLSQLTHRSTQTLLIQKTIQNYAKGDKRILFIDGAPVKKAILRIPPQGGFCANLAAGGTAKGAELTSRDREICDAIAPVLSEMNLLFVGIDVINGYLTEINFTSPTCLRELNAIYTMDLGTDLIQAIERKLK